MKTSWSCSSSLEMSLQLRCKSKRGILANLFALAFVTSRTTSLLCGRFRSSTVARLVEKLCSVRDIKRVQSVFVTYSDNPNCGGKKPMIFIIGGSYVSVGLMD
jgi:hypothetical protein